MWKIENIYSNTSYLCSNPCIAVLDIILELLFDCIFTFLSLLISIWYSTGPLGLILNAMIVYWISEVDNNMVKRYFSNEDMKDSKFLSKFNRGESSISVPVRLLLYILSIFVFFAILGIGIWGQISVIPRRLQPEQNTTCSGIL